MKKFFIPFICVLLTLIFTFDFGCKQKDEELTFYTPDGAPALAVSKLIFDNETFGKKSFSYNVVSGAEIKNAILKNGADFVVMPLNTATKLYKDNGVDDYKLVSVLTHGNFYILSKENITSVFQLVGKVIAVPSRGAVPDLTVQAVLKQNDIAYETGTTKIDNKVVIDYTYKEGSDIVKGLLTSKIQVGLIPEPARTTLKDKGSFYELDLQKEYDGVNKKYPQAVLMVKKSIADNDGELILKVKEKLNASILWAEENPTSAVSSIKRVYENSTLSDDLPSVAVKGCNIYLLDGEKAKDEITLYTERIRAINTDFIDVVGEEFYL